MNGSTGFFAVELATNLRCIGPTHRACAGHPDVGGETPQHAQAALAVGCLFWIGRRCQHPMSHALTTFSTRSPSRTGNDHDVQPRVCPAVTCAVSAIGPTRIVSPSLNRWSTRGGG